jgi:hypothetical protein
MFLSEKDWQIGENIFRHEVVSKGPLAIEDHAIIFILSGKFELSYYDKRTPEINDDQFANSTIKSLHSGDICCIFDIERIDMFDADRKLQLHLSCTELDTTHASAEYIAVNNEKLHEFLSMSHLHTLRHFFLVRCVNSSVG